MAVIKRFKGLSPEIHEEAYVAEGASLIGDVVLAERSSVWFNSVLRADRGRISIGKNSSIQDCCVLHGEVSVEEDVIVGHSAVLHNAIIRCNCLIGMNATVMDGAVVGPFAIVAAGSVVVPGTIVEEGSMFAGTPARRIRDLTDTERKEIKEAAESYYSMMAKPQMEF